MRAESWEVNTDSKIYDFAIELIEIDIDRRGNKDFINGIENFLIKARIKYFGL